MRLPSTLVEWLSNPESTDRPRAIAVAGLGGRRRALTLRADSGFYSGKVAAACRRAGVAFSITVKLNKALHRAIAAIPEGAWAPIPYFLDGADVAETTYRPFGAKAPLVRLIVRRVRPTPGSQLALLVDYAYHGFVTDRQGATLELEADHRRHAVVEDAIRDLKYGVGLNHMPSGRFGANAAWLGLNVNTDTATRWTMEALAGRMAEHGVPISASQVWRICRSLDLKPWQTESWMTSHDPDFWEKAGDVCDLYLNPPDNVVVWSVDEKTGIQAKSRVNPTRPAVPAGHAGERAGTPVRGRPVRQEFEYKRNGTVMLFAALNVHGGEVAGWVADSSRSDNFVLFLQDLIDQTPAGLDLHCICDNLSAHKSTVVTEFLERPENAHLHLHYTPTHASWLNQVELFFSIMQRRLLSRGEFASVDDLADKIIDFINDYNRRAKPFKWTHAGRPLQVA